MGHNYFSYIQECVKNVLLSVINALDLPIKIVFLVVRVVLKSKDLTKQIQCTVRVNAPNFSL